MQRRLVVLAPAAHAVALAECVAHLGSTPRLALVSSACGDAGEDAVEVLDARLTAHEEGPFDGALVLATPDTVDWARRAIAQAAGVGPVVLLARGLRPQAVRELLAAGAREFVLWDCQRGEARVRIERALAAADAAGTAAGASAAPPRPAASRAPKAAAPPAVPASASRFAPASPRCTHPRLASVIGESPALLATLRRVPRIAGCDAGVLILGETGTGKDLFAQAVHYLSPRADGPFVAVNCGALPGDLVESELFGHARGAFTSAHESHIGLVAQAEGGTLFLDEVDSLPPLAQVKLLRFLQDKEYRSVGAPRPRRADVRIVAACNVDLAALCDGSGFRTDLFYRLNVLALHLPALRERGADVLALAAHFVASFARRFDRQVQGLAPSARLLLMAYDWPGNVRELEHAIERAVLLAEGAWIEAEELGLPTSARLDEPAAGGTRDDGRLEPFRSAKARAVAQFERRYIEDALARCGGNITHAADAVAKNRRAFFELMRKHGIDSCAYREPG